MSMYLANVLDIDVGVQKMDIEPNFQHEKEHE